MPCPCQLCPSTDATVHLTELSPGGAPTELHLCRACIVRLGISLEPPPSIAAVLAASEAQPVAAGASAPTGAEPTVGSARGVADESCPVCGLAWSAYVQSNLLGCPDCWLAFLGPLDELVERYQGSREHLGRRPAGMSPVVTAQTTARRSRAARRHELQAALAEAVRGERFELAASLRDQLRILEADGE